MFILNICLLQIVAETERDGLRHVMERKSLKIIFLRYANANPEFALSRNTCVPRNTAREPLLYSVSIMYMAVRAVRNTVNASRLLMAAVNFIKRQWKMRRLYH